MKGGRIARTLLVVVFISLLAVPLVLKRFRARSETANTSLGTAAALGRYGFHLTETARSAGIDFVHQAPTLDRKLDHIMPQVASMGAGV